MIRAISIAIVCLMLTACGTINCGAGGGDNDRAGSCRAGTTF